MNYYVYYKLKFQAAIYLLPFHYYKDSAMIRGFHGQALVVMRNHNLEGIHVTATLTPLVTIVSPKCQNFIFR